MASHPTLPSQQRANVMRTYRHRGRRDRQLYLVYSVKTSRDWILSSDVRFLHWILYLETDPDVVSFELHDDVGDREAPERRAGVYALARVRSNRIVAHRILLHEESVTQNSLPSTYTDPSEEIRLISESELRKNASVAMRWAKVICFAAALRDQRHVSESARRCCKNQA